MPQFITHDLKLYVTITVVCSNAATCNTSQWISRLNENVKTFKFNLF